MTGKSVSKVSVHAASEIPKEPTPVPSETRSELAARLEADFEEAVQLYENEIQTLREKQHQLIDEHAHLEEQQREELALEIDQHRLEVERLNEAMVTVQKEKEDSLKVNQKINEELTNIKESILPAVYGEATKIIK